jgi:DNA (cytosine-5)-methyltransferase 1
MFDWKWRLSEIRHDKPVSVFSMFSCGGGSSMGYKRAGFDVIGNVEIDEKINRMYVKNLHPRFNFNMDAREFVKKTDLPSELYNLDILDGSPPCTTFSTAGKREKSWGVVKTFSEGRQKQRLDDLFFVYLEAVNKLKPKICVAENVEGLIKGNARGYVSEIIDMFRDIGYDVQLFVLDSQYMNVPQKRTRVFFIANRMGFKKLILNFNEKPVTFGECKSPHGKRLKEGSLTLNILKNTTGMKKNISLARKDGRKGGFNESIVYDETVCPTLVSGACIYRFDRKEYFSDQDIINVSSFPQDYDFCGNSAKYVCGMSVPPNMMANIANKIWQQWLMNENQHD